MTGDTERAKAREDARQLAEAVRVFSKRNEIGRLLHGYEYEHAATVLAGAVMVLDAAAGRGEGTE